MGEEEKKTEEEVEVESVVIKHETLVESLAYGQLEYGPLEKTEKVDFTTKEGRRIQYSYADLASTRKATDPHLNKHGLTVTDRTETREGDKEFLITKLRHAFSCEFDETEMEITTVGDIKDKAAKITYARRYNYGNVTGRAPEEDNDAQDVDRRSDEQQENKQQSRDDKKAKTPLEKAKATYFALLTKNKVFKNDGERHEWQKKTPYGFSTEKWTKAGFEGAAGLMNWRLTVGIESDELLEFTTTKAKSTRGLQAQFLKLMGVKKLIDIKDISYWKIGMASAKLSIDHKLEAALDMGKACIRADKTEGLFAKVLEVIGVEKMSSMSKEQVAVWETSFRSAVNQFQTEHTDVDLDVEKLVSGEEESGS